MTELKPVKHLIASGISGGLFYLYSQSILASFVCFLSGILIDLDHFCDFYLHYKRFVQSLKEFYLSCVGLKFEKFYLFFHSWELIILLWLLIIILKLNLIWVAASTGVTLHMALDTLGNNSFPFAYFFIYRVRKKFRAKLLFKDA